MLKNLYLSLKKQVDPSQRESKQESEEKLEDLWTTFCDGGRNLFFSTLLPVRPLLLGFANWLR